VKQHTTTPELEEHIRVLQAELASRKSATHTSVYDRAGVRDEHRDLFDDVVYAICEDNMSITEVSTPSRAGFIHGNAKNWVRNLGNLSAFKATCGNHTNRVLTKWASDEPSLIEVSNVDIPEHICKLYLQSRKDGGSGFTTKLTMVEVGTYEGNPFGIVQKPNGARWAIGNITNADKVVAVPMQRGLYKSVDKATKGQRQTCDILVFDPLG
tara:strand:+ start:200 stop:832 length:633 start_codon:yes stop_codon:yes gene_type:complete